jgi:RNA polymerase sigma factor (TIGR02999 family)
MSSQGELHTATQLLNRMGAGDREAAQALAPLVYDELRVLAGSFLARNPAQHTLPPTALVHEAWLRFADGGAHFENRHRFYAFAAKIMRSVLCDHARAQAAEKRGGDRERITLAEDARVGQHGELDLLDVDAAMRRLEAMDEDLHRLVELRFFAGLSHPEIAELTGVPLRTVERRWALARAWLLGELGP